MANPTQQVMGGEWMKFKGKLREAWGALNDNDLDRYEGQLDQLIGHIQKTTGHERAKIKDEIDRIAKDVKYRF